MNIDAQIQEILLRSTPCNDNGFKPIANPESSSRSISHISVVGNHNVVVTSGLWAVYLLFGMMYTWLLLANH